MAVQPVMWQGWCDRCGQPAGGARDREQKAQHDIDECPCDADMSAEKLVKDLVPGDLVDTVVPGGSPWEVTDAAPSTQRKGMWTVRMTRDARSWDMDYHPDESVPVARTTPPSKQSRIPDVPTPNYTTKISVGQTVGE